MLCWILNYTKGKNVKPKGRELIFSGVVGEMSERLQKHSYRDKSLDCKQCHPEILKLTKRSMHNTFSLDYWMMKKAYNLLNARKQSKFHLGTLLMGIQNGT